MRSRNHPPLCLRATAGSMAGAMRCSDLSVSLTFYGLSTLRLYIPEVWIIILTHINQCQTAMTIFTYQDVHPACSHEDRYTEQSSRLGICRVWELQSHGWSVSSSPSLHSCYVSVLISVRLACMSNPCPSSWKIELVHIGCCHHHLTSPDKLDIAVQQTRRPRRRETLTATPRARTSASTRCAECRPSRPSA